MDAPNSNQLIREHYRRFLKSSGKCKSEKAISDYLLSLEMFEREAGGNFLERIQDYRDFHWIMEALADRTQWPDGRRKKRWSLRMTYKVASECCVFFEWAHAFKFTPHQPCKDGHRFEKSEGTPPEFFDWSEPDFKKILYDPNNTVRMKAAMHVLRASGIRASELCNLRRCDIDDSGLVIRRGKGGDSRFAPIDMECKGHLEEHLQCLEHHYSGEWLFPKEDYSGPINAHGLWKMLYNKGRKLGIRVYPHKFRHSLGGELSDRGVEDLAISEILGHKDLKTTRQYFHMKKRKLSKVYQQAFSQSA